MKEISSFRGRFAFFSNFFPALVVLDGKSYPTVEHAFQAAKTEREEVREVIRQASTPGQAKRLGRKVVLRKNWEYEKTSIMLDLLRQKFRNPQLRQKLLQTNDATLIERNNWGDKFWGCVFENGEWIGENHLGHLLMQVRDEINESER